MNISEKNSALWLTVCWIFSKLLIKRASVYKFYYRNTRLRLDLRSQRTIWLLITITISLNIQIDKFIYRSDLETTILASFPSNSLNYTVISSYLQRLSTLTNFILIGNVYCPDTKWSDKHGLHKNTSQSLGRSDCQCPQRMSVCQVRNFPFEDQKFAFFFWFGQVFHIF